jgi:type II secretory pathway pseudopilin PulG
MSPLALRADEARTTRDVGMSLVELLVAIVLLGVTGTAVLTAFTTSIHASVVNRTQVAGTVWLQSASDYLSTTAFVDCVAGAEEQVAARYQQQLLDAAAPKSTTGWPQASLVVSGPVLFWDNGRFVPQCSPSSGVQRIPLQVKDAASGQTVELDVVKSRASQ